jgi:Ni,Fe-hydrogenase III large subunit
LCLEHLVVDGGSFGKELEASGEEGDEQIDHEQVGEDRVPAEEGRAQEGDSISNERERVGEQSAQLIESKGGQGD